MRRILLYFVLCSMALASSEILYTKDRIVMVNNKVTTHEHKGRYFYKADIYFVWQRDFWQDVFLKNWLTGYVPMTLHDFREFALVYNPWPPPWVLANITKEQWLDWEKTGKLHTVEYLESQARNAVIKAAAQADRDTMVAMMEISELQYYISPSGVWHVDPNCPDNVGCIAVSPFDVLKYENRKACEKCTGVK